MSRKFFLTAVIILFAISFAVIAAAGRTYEASISISNLPSDEGVYKADDFSVNVEDGGIISVSDMKVEGDCLRFKISPLNRGADFVRVEHVDAGSISYENYYVHRLGIITRDSFFGDCTGGVVIPVAVMILLVLLYIDRIRKHRIEVKNTLYSYRNVMNFGFIVFLTFMLAYQFMGIMGFNGIERTVSTILSSAEFFAYIILPIALVVSVLISLSNISLMRKEGVNWRNMLGFILGPALIVLTLMPGMLYKFFLTHNVVDIFNEKAFATHAFKAFENIVYAVVAYMECILAGAVVFGIRAAKRVPAFDKDYIIIHGSQIRPDGTLTPLLRSRADRALEFARMQKEATGKDIIFVPSGGKGGDEIISEAEAIAEYLRSKGVPEEQILLEDRSLNTYENIRNSDMLTKKDYAEKHPGMSAESGPKVAFSTTNYHVFRAGLIAYEQGVRMEGVGSSTKAYFWINAFIREFIATLVSEKRRHLKVVFTLIIGIIILVAINYLAVLL